MDAYLAISVFFILAFALHGIIYKRVRAHKIFDETPRQMLHAAIGLFVIFIGLVFGVTIAKIMILGSLSLGLVIIFLKSIKMEFYIVKRLLNKFERPGFAAGYGALAYFVGMLFCLSFFETQLAFYIIYIMAICDAAATIIGKKYGRFNLPYNDSKSFEGLFAFLIFAIPIVVLGGDKIVLVVLVSAFLETLEIGIDDNIIVPMAGFVYGII